jgi:hypothetical protein
MQLTNSNTRRNLDKLRRAQRVVLPLVPWREDLGVEHDTRPFTHHAQRATRVARAPASLPHGCNGERSGRAGGLGRCHSAGSRPMPTIAGVLGPGRSILAP